MAIKLYCLKDSGSLWMTANTFGVHQCTVSKTLSEVCKAINEILVPKHLYLPRNIEEMREIVSKFEVKLRILKVFGCIDGKHVPLMRPLLIYKIFIITNIFF